MAFTLTADDGSQTTFGDEATYTFNEAGLLVINTNDGHNLTYSPAGWRNLDEPAPPPFEFSR